VANDELKRIDRADIVEYMGRASDFAFEMQALQLLVGAGFECRHAATYKDPVTQKPRQYDIRGKWASGESQVLLAAECKNLRETAPILVHTTPRSPAESYHELIVRKRDVIVTTATQRLSGADSLYRPSHRVGKQLDQISRKKKAERLRRLGRPRVRQMGTSCERDT
jgi:hypothetical protein